MKITADEDQPGSAVLARKKIRILETATSDSLFPDNEDDLVEEFVISPDPIWVSVSRVIPTSILEPNRTPSTLPWEQDSGLVHTQA